VPEVFQRKNYELFGDIPNVHIVFDDIMIAVVDDAKHDTGLRELLERVRKYNVRFNRALLRMAPEPGTDCQRPSDHQNCRCVPSSANSRLTCSSTRMLASSSIVRRCCGRFSEFGAVYKFSD